MNTTALTKKQQQVNDLTEYANLLQQNGFTVIVSKKHPFEWIYFEKDGKIGTVSPGNFYGLNFSSVHKPCRECGTGFSTDREVTEPTIYATVFLHLEDVELCVPRVSSATL